MKSPSTPGRRGWAPAAVALSGGRDDGRLELAREAFERREYELAQRAAALGTRLLGGGKWLKRLPPPLNAWTQRRDFPPFAAQSFRARWAAKQKQKKGGPA